MADLGAIDRDKVLEFATRFRRAMEEVDLEAMAIGFRMFPRGACSDTSLLLGTALQDHGLGRFQYVCASKSEGGSFESHAWLRAGSLIVDITADQFDGMPPVFVGQDTGWHEKWGPVTDLGDGDYRQCTGGYATELEGSYSLIMAKLS